MAAPAITKPKETAPWKAWLAAALWLTLIAMESSNTFSSANTGAFLYHLLTSWFGAIDPFRFLVWHSYFRKFGHVFGYGVLSWLMFRAWRVTFSIPGTHWSLRWARLAWLTTVAVATLDEWHQSLFPARTGTYRDVVLDGIAALAVQIVVWLLLRRAQASR